MLRQFQSFNRRRWPQKLPVLYRTRIKTSLQNFCSTEQSQINLECTFIDAFQNDKKTRVTPSVTEYANQEWKFEMVKFKTPKYFRNETKHITMIWKAFLSRSSKSFQDKQNFILWQLPQRNLCKIISEFWSKALNLQSQGAIAYAWENISANSVRMVSWTLQEYNILASSQEAKLCWAPHSLASYRTYLKNTTLINYKVCRKISSIWQ